MHENLKRLVALRGHDHQCSDPIELQICMAREWAACVLSGRVTMEQKQCLDYSIEKHPLTVLWCLHGTPIGATSVEAQSMLAWLGLAHLPCEWVPMAKDNDDAFDLQRESNYGHFSEYTRAMASCC